MLNAGNDLAAMLKGPRHQCRRRPRRPSPPPDRRSSAEAVRPRRGRHRRNIESLWVSTSEQIAAEVDRRRKAGNSFNQLGRAMGYSRGTIVRAYDFAKPGRSPRRGEGGADAASAEGSRTFTATHTCVPRCGAWRIRLSPKCIAFLLPIAKARTDWVRCHKKETPSKALARHRLAAGRGQLGGSPPSVGTLSYSGQGLPLLHRGVG